MLWAASSRAASAGVEKKEIQASSVGTQLYKKEPFKQQAPFGVLRPGAVALSLTLVYLYFFQADVGNLDAVRQDHRGAVAAKELRLDGGFLGQLGECRSRLDPG